MIDCHVHVDLYPDPDNIIRQCKLRGIEMISVTTTPSAWHETCALGKGGIGVRTALGLHPQLAHERFVELALFDQLLEHTDYVGEIGLDGSEESRPHWERQVLVFDHILDACSVAGGKILSIHSRRSIREVLDRLEMHSGAGVPILHWFSGSIRDLERAVALGCWFSVGPAMLSSRRGVELASRMPIGRVLTESDGPLARVGDRALFPWDVRSAVMRMAQVWKVNLSLTEAILEHNKKRLFDSL